MSDFETEVLNDLGRYRETEEAVMERIYSYRFGKQVHILVDALNRHHAEYQSIGADLATPTEPPKAMRISLRLKPDGIRVEK